MINRHQAIILVIICVLATKLQRLPSIISYSVGRDGWFVLLILGILDLIYLMISLWFFNRHNQTSNLYEVLVKSGGKFFAKLFLLFLATYFFIMAVLPFAAIHDLFANILFDELNYTYFGLIFLFVVMFMALKGIQTLGRQGEIYVGIIGVGIIGVLLLSIPVTQIDRILPMLDISATKIVKEVLYNSLWFGDFMIIFFITGMVNMRKNEKLGWRLFLPYAILVLIIIPSAYVVFYSIYNNLAGFKTNAISSLTQFSLLTLDIGRVDWFLVLFEQISTILSSSVFVFITATCLCKTLGIKKQSILIILLSSALFIIDVFVFVNMDLFIPRFRKVVYIYCLFINYVLPFIFVVCSLVFAKKQRKQKNDSKIEQSKIIHTKTTKKLKLSGQKPIAGGQDG